jgi:hypothetical protein
VIAFVVGLVMAPVAVALWIVAAGSAQQLVAAILAIVVVSAIALTVLQRPRSATAGGLLLGVGLTFAYLFGSQATSCTQAKGCTLGDNTVQVSILVGFVIAGLIMSVYALTRPAAHT